jgi:hypothetical protein
VRGVLDSREAARRLSDALNAQGTRAWAMKAFRPPQSKAISLSNGEVAIAIAISIGGDKVHAVAIGPSGRAEAIARG